MSERPKLRLVKNDEPQVPDECDYELKDPSEHGWQPKRKIDFNHLQSLGHIAGNPFYKEGEDDDLPPAA